MIGDLYTERTIQVKPKCTPSVLYRDNAGVHDVYMPATKPKKVISRLKRPQYAPTKIREWREYRKKTQQQLADLVTTYLQERGLRKSYTYASIGRIETGKIPYSQPILEAVADALGTDPASLLMRDPSDPAGFWTIWERAKPAERQTITEHAEIVVKKAAR